jgi:hypothetical protein
MRCVLGREPAGLFQNNASSSGRKGFNSVPHENSLAALPGIGLVSAYTIAESQGSVLLTFLLTRSMFLP